MKRTWKEIIGIGGLLVFIITLAIAFVILFTPLYSWTAQYFNIAESVGLTHEALMENYHVLIQYLNLPWMDTLNFPDFESSASGLFHFYEVKKLFYLDYILLVISGVISFFFLRHVKKNKRGFVLINPIRVMSILPIVLTIVLAVNFDWLFTAFHQVLFNNDAWLFNPATDPIINVLPQEFFMICFVVVFVLFELCLWLAYRYAKKHSYLY